MASVRHKAQDRRVQRTQGLLHEALGSLIREKPYGMISVKEILDRANIGRSTFYMHFRDKDELLASGVRSLLHSGRATDRPVSTNGYEDILWFSLPIFMHIHDHKQTGGIRIGAEARADLHEQLRKALVGVVADAVEEKFGHRRKTKDRISPDLRVDFVISTFVLVLNWWVESRSSLAAREIDDVFRAMVRPTLAAMCERRAGID
jgi:AcrR family transcriptional regulator